LYFNHILFSLKRRPEDILHDFVFGGAGVGKSVLARAVFQAAIRIFNSRPGTNRGSIKVLVIAPTGTAAYNVGGFTIHSALEIPATQSLKNYKHLSAEQKARLETALENVNLIVHEEISMTGRTMFDYINLRLQDIKGDKTRPFRGVHYTAFGDLFQLPPVFDKYIFEDITDETLDMFASNIWKDLFSLFELKTIMRQRDAAVFAERLNRLREGDHTPEDLLAFKERLLSLASNRSMYSLLNRHMFVLTGK
jgi:hypothetical protein